jgi:hypothetical protein
MSNNSKQSMSEVNAPKDFDFLFGSWQIHNRRLDNPLSESSPWSEFEAPRRRSPSTCASDAIPMNRSHPLAS